MTHPSRAPSSAAVHAVTPSPGAGALFDDVDAGTSVDAAPLDAALDAPSLDAFIAPDAVADTALGCAAWPDGTACDDRDICTTDSFCESGACVAPVEIASCVVASARTEYATTQGLDGWWYLIWYPTAETDPYDPDALTELVYLTDRWRPSGWEESPSANFSWGQIQDFLVPLRRRSARARRAALGERRVGARDGHGRARDGHEHRRRRNARGALRRWRPGLGEHHRRARRGERHRRRRSRARGGHACRPRARATKRGQRRHQRSRLIRTAST